MLPHVALRHCLGQIAEDYRMDPRLHNMCADSVKRLCPRIEPGNGEELDCLVRRVPHARAHTHTHTHTHTRTYTKTHTCTHTQTHVLKHVHTSSASAH